MLVGAPAGLPDGVLVSGRPAGASALRVQLCNVTTAAVPAQPALDYSFVAIGGRSRPTPLRSPDGASSGSRLIAP